MAGGKILILVVERDPHVRELEAHFLNSAGFAVEFAQDGHAALAQAQTRHPDLVITEILVLQLDGLALCRQLKADAETADISVLVFSILASRVRAMEAVADAFLESGAGRTPFAEARWSSFSRSVKDVRRLRHDDRFTRLMDRNSSHPAFRRERGAGLDPRARISRQFHQHPDGQPSGNEPCWPRRWYSPTPPTIVRSST